MLVMVGTAEYTFDDGERKKGIRYAFNVFSKNENLKDNIENIGVFLGDLGWNEIDIKRTKIISNESNIDNKILREAFEYALLNDLSVVNYTDPVDEVLKL